MILLNDEEINQVEITYPRREPIQSVLMKTIRANNKAQLKKVMEWGNSYCQSGSHGSEVGNDMFPIPKRECSDCWQVLLKEIK